MADDSPKPWVSGPLLDSGEPDGGASSEAIAETLPSGEGGAPAITFGELGEELCGRQLQHFRIEQMIGRGGMGTVYRAHDQSLDRPVALKVVDASMVQDPTLRERFVREARAQGRLSHPHVVQIHSIGEQDGLSFFAMEIVEGESLEELILRGEPLDWQRALELMIEVASALKLAQGHGIIHRDIKPSNLLVDAAGAVKVADFGLAKWVNHDVKITQEGTVLGTPLYMSPEQGQGEATDHRADIYSLGATFYHLVAGAPPFTAKTPVALVVKHVTDPVPSLSSCRSEVSEAFSAVVGRMMAKDPAARFDSYDELIGALEAVRPQRNTPAGLWVRAMAVAVDGTLMLVVAALLRDLFWLVFVPYFVVGWWRWGQTVGKWLFRIRVRTKANGPVGLGASLRRFVVFAVGVWIMVALDIVSRVGSGYWLEELPEEHRMIPVALGVMALALLVNLAVFGVAGLRRDRRAVHDLVASTTVVYKLDD